MAGIPKDPVPDNTLGFGLHGYNFIRRKAQQLNSDIFQTRLLFKPTICMLGEENARLFYDTDRFQREGAAPSRVKKTLFGVGGVQGLDGDEHRHRKEMFMSLMSPERVRQLAEVMVDVWMAQLGRWEAMEHVVLYEEANQIICRAVCAWAGVPLPETDVERRARDLVGMIEGSGAVGPRHWRGRRARRRGEKWMSELVRRVRSGALEPGSDTALHVIATHCNRGGRELPDRIAAVEVLNILRPTVAVSRYIVFSALALHAHPEWRARLRDGSDDLLKQFVQEVRRFYPFFPIVGAIVRDTFDWNGYRFPRGRRVVLDLYGTNHDPRQWQSPDDFRPERFAEWDGSPFNFIPQGGGDFVENHRCAGEWVTIELTKAAVRLLVTEVEYQVPEQDLEISMARIPAIPRSRFVLRGVRRDWAS